MFLLMEIFYILPHLLFLESLLNIENLLSRLPVCLILPASLLATLYLAIIIIFSLTSYSCFMAGGLQRLPDTVDTGQFCVLSGFLHGFHGDCLI